MRIWWLGFPESLEHHRRARELLILMSTSPLLPPSPVYTLGLRFKCHMSHPWAFGDVRSALGQVLDLEFWTTCLLEFGSLKPEGQTMAGAAL